MFRKPVRHAAYTDDDPPIVLALRYATEPRPKPLRGFFFFSAVYAALLLPATFSFDARSIPPPKGGRITTLYVPPPPRPHRQKSPETTALLSRATTPKLEDPVEVLPLKGKFDLTSTEIAFEEDLSNELPEVIRQQRGVIALLERDDPSVTSYIFEPPDWRMREAIIDVSGKIRLTMYQPSKWALLRALAQKYSINLDRYQVCALFDSAYAHCLDREIRGRAEASTGSGRVKGALLVFTSGSACGINVLSVQFAAVP